MNGVPWQSRNHEAGISLIELMVTLSLVAILSGIAISSAIKDFNDDSRNAALEFIAHVKGVQAKAVSTTSAYTITAVNNTSLTATYGKSCTSATQTSDPEWAFTLPSGAEFATSGWTYCTNSLGFADQNISISITDGDQPHGVELMLGGAVEIQ